MGASVERLNRTVFAFQDLRRQVLAKADSLIDQFNSQKMGEPTSQIRSVAFFSNLYWKIRLAGWGILGGPQCKLPLTHRTTFCE